MVAKKGVPRRTERHVALNAGGIAIAQHYFDQMSGISSGRRQEKQRIHKRKDGGIRSQSQGQRKDDGDCEYGRLFQLPQGISHVGPDRFESGPLPYFTAALFEQGGVAK